jgi:hypothetical protein
MNYEASSIFLLIAYTLFTFLNFLPSQFLTLHGCWVPLFILLLIYLIKTFTVATQENNVSRNVSIVTILLAFVTFIYIL